MLDLLVYNNDLLNKMLGASYPKQKKLEYENSIDEIIQETVDVIIKNESYIQKKIVKSSDNGKSIRQLFTEIGAKIRKCDRSSSEQISRHCSCSDCSSSACKNIRFKTFQNSIAKIRAEGLKLRSNHLTDPNRDDPVNFDKKDQNTPVTSASITGSDSLEKRRHQLRKVAIKKLKDAGLCMRPLKSEWGVHVCHTIQKGTHLSLIPPLEKLHPESINQFIISVIGAWDESFIPELILYALSFSKEDPEHYLMRLDNDKILKLAEIKEYNHGVLEYIKKMKAHFDLYKMNGVSEYKKFTRLGYVTSISNFKQAFTFRGYPLVKEMLKRVNNKWIVENSNEIFQALLNSQDIFSAELLRERFPQIAKYCSPELFVSAVRTGKQEVVDWLIKHGIKIETTNIKNIISCALESRNLHIIRQLCIYAKKLGVDNIFYHEILGLDAMKDLDRDALEKILFDYALSSPMELIYDLVKRVPQFGSVLPSVLNKISLTVRFASTDQAQELCSENYDAEKFDRTFYLKTSMAYANENLDFLKKTLPKVKRMDRNLLWKTIMHNRFVRTKKTKYNTTQIDDPHDFHTPMRRPSDGLPMRYAWSYRHLLPFVYDLKNNKWVEISLDNMSVKPNSVSFFYNIPGVGKHLVSGFRNDCWVHPIGEAVKPFQNILKKLHQDIMAYKLDMKNPENKKVFFEMVATCYWLMATLCETHGGTPHNVMMWLNLVYKHHKLPPPIPKRDHFFLDNTMLMIPVDEAIRRWHEFFEPAPPDELLSFPSKNLDFKRTEKKVQDARSVLTLEQTKRLKQLEAEKGEVRWTQKEREEYESLKKLSLDET